MIFTDNPLLSIAFTLEMLANLGALNVPKGPIPASLMPLLIGVEEVRKKGIPLKEPPEAIRYILVFPGSQFLKIAVKVEETTPSITPAELAARGGFVKVSVEGFKSGNLPTDDGGARPYFKATKIVPIADDPSTQK